MPKARFEFDPFEFAGVEVPRGTRDEAKQIVADYVKEQVLHYVGEGRSPVSGGPWRRKLTKEYLATKDAFSNVAYSNLELTGDMLDAFDVRSGRGGNIVVEVTGSEAGKAEGNNIGSYGGTPDEDKARRFIPIEGEKFNQVIRNGIRDILKDFEDTSGE